MSPRLLPIAWILLPLLLITGLAWEMKYWHSLGALSTQAQTEQRRLRAELAAQKEKIAQELRGHVALLKEMRWSPDRTDPSIFLRGLADLAHGEQIKVVSIGPLERGNTDKFRKSWHTVGVSTRFRDLKDLASRIEAEGAVLEDVVVEVPKEAKDTGSQGRPRDELRAQFRLTAMELSEQGRAIVERALTADRSTVAVPATTATLTLPAAAQRPTSPETLRDPFAFVAIGRSSPVRAAVAGRQPSVSNDVAAPPTPISVSGILEFPSGYLAIVNQKIVKVADVVDGHRVDNIAKGHVVLRQPDGTRRTVPLADFAIDQTSRARERRSQ